MAKQARLRAQFVKQGVLGSRAIFVHQENIEVMTTKSAWFVNLVITLLTLANHFAKIARTASTVISHRLLPARVAVRVSFKIEQEQPIVVHAVLKKAKNYKSASYRTQREHPVRNLHGQF